MYTSVEKNMNKNVFITPEQYDYISNIQQKILAKLVVDEPTINILDDLCVLAESLLPNAVASIMLIDSTTGFLNILCAPSISKDGHDALANLQPGPNRGSCGSAVFHNKPQFVENTFEDERWSELRHIAYDFNLCSCWSTPVRDKNDIVLGTFSLSFVEHKTPALFHKKLLETCASIASLVLKKQIREKRLKLFSTAIHSASEGMFITDKNNHIIEVNPAFEKIYGYKEDDVLGKNPSIISSGRQNKHFYQQMWQELNTTNKWRGEVINQHNNGSYINQWMSITVMRDDDGKIQNYLSIFSDLTELKTTQKKVIDMAFHDSITLLRNQAFLEQQLLNSEKKYTLILLNINNFSVINTAYGFDVGDKILKVIAQAIVDNFITHSTYRLNSDEFALLFDTPIDVVAKIKKIQNYFYNTLIHVDDISLHISFTYGAVYGNKHLLRNSALALKQAKLLGKNRYHIFDESSEKIDKSYQEHFISGNNLLHLALEQARVVPFFQGIYNNRTQQIIKFEVLARIIENDRILSPFHFLSSAKLSGLLPEITRVMIDKSFKIMSTNDYQFSLNITEDDLSQNFLSNYLAEKSTQYNIKPGRIILEILEGVSAIGKRNHTEQLTKLKSQGYLLAIDDFGTEYSNFERILDLDIDYLKIDAKYIRDIDVNKKSYEITKAIAYFAHNAGIPCIAEFVHNEPVQNIIKELGIDYSQGYYFSEPSAQPNPCN